MGPIRVQALPQTLQALREHLFNNALWPDFTTLPTPESPVLSLHPLEVGQRLRIGGRMVQVLPARHAVPAVGYALWNAEPPNAPVWAFSGDTGPNPEVWPVLRGLPLAHWVMEVAFADRDRPIAEVSGHHCPATLDPELLQLPHGTQVHLTHIKPGEEAAVLVDLKAMGLDARCRLLRIGDEFTL